MKNSEEVKKLIEVAVNNCSVYGNKEVTEYHLMRTMIDVSVDVIVPLLLISKCSVNDLVVSLNDSIDNLPISQRTPENIVLSTGAEGVIIQAQLLANKRGSDTCELVDILYIMANNGGVIYHLLLMCGFSHKHFKYEFEKEGGNTKIDNPNKTIDNNMSDFENTPLRGGKKNKKEDKTPFLSENGRNLNELAASGEIQDVIGRETELFRMMNILVRKKKRNPLIIGDAGVGKTTLAEALALRIVKGDVHEYFKGKVVFLLELVNVVAGTKFRGEFEEKMLRILKEVEENPNIILFIDEVHQLVGSGSTQGSMDGSNILKPALASGKIQVIGSTTHDEYKKHFSSDKALVRRFSKVSLDEPTEVETVEILKGIRHIYEDYHGVSFNDEIIEQSVKLSGRLIKDRFFPDKAIDFVDELCSFVRLTKGIDTNKEIEVELKRISEIDSLISETNKEIDELTKKTSEYEKAARVRDVKKRLEAEKSQLQLVIKEKNEKQKEHKLVATLDELLIVASKLTGVSLESLNDDTTNFLVNLESVLNQKVIGQSEAVSVMCDSILRQKARVKDPNKPSVLLFLGQTGTGKTLLAKETAKYVYGSDSNFIRVNMSDYQDAFTVTNLTGSPKGYVGSDEGSFLHERVKKNPHSIILLDEIEKAHPKVFNSFLQIFDEGEAVDGNGEKISFRECIFVLTSNIGMKEVSELKNFNIFKIHGDDVNKRESIIENALKKKFSPELINRIGKIVTFNNITLENAGIIADIEIEKIKSRLVETNKTISITTELRDEIIKEGYSDEYGARNIARTVERLVETPLSKLIVWNPVQTHFILDTSNETAVVI